MSTFRISREGDMLVLDGERLRWEYDVPGGTFVLKDERRAPDSQVPQDRVARALTLTGRR